MVSKLSATVIIKVFRLRPPLLQTTDTYAQTSLWKETIKKAIFKSLRVSKKTLFEQNHDFQPIKWTL